MTNEEAIEVLERMYPKRTQMVDGRRVGGFNDYDSPKGIAISKAIQSLSRQNEIAVSEPNVVESHEATIEVLYEKIEELMERNKYLTSLVIEMADAYCEHDCSLYDCDNCKIYKITKGEIKEDGIDG